MTWCNLLQFLSQLENRRKELLNRQPQKKVRERELEGLETFPKALRAVFNGGQIARMLVNVDKQPQQSL